MAKKEWRDFRVESRNSYGGDVTIQDDGRPLVDQGFLQKGALLRIADALERLAIGKTELETQDELAKTRIDVSILRRERDYQKLQIAGLRGVITKLQKKLKETRK